MALDPAPHLANKGSAAAPLEEEAGPHATYSHSGGRRLIRVVSPGFQTTVQDLGRFGYAHMGVSASGAADVLALRAGNLLVGNPENAPALEMTLLGGVFEIEADTVIAFTGSDFGAGFPLWTAIEVKAGCTIRCGATRSSARCYLSVRGGIETPLVLGSASTHVLTGLGGRVLARGDTLVTGTLAIQPPRYSASAPAFLGPGPLRVTAGPQARWFSDELYGAPYCVTEASSRMGLRLRGQAIAAPTGEMLTQGASLGAIQIPPDGQPIILFVEHQTTGGYPIIANVICADLWRVGQLRPRDEAQFERVGIQQALDLLDEQERWLSSLAQS